MRTLIIDVGCSNIKLAVYEGESLLRWYKHPTPKDNRDIFLPLSQQHYNVCQEFGVDRTMVISYSDSIFYQRKGGDVDYIPVNTDLKPQKGVPDYQVAGKPSNSELIGMAHQLIHLKEHIGLHCIERILPPSTMIAAEITGNRAWKKWDITHAGNSGMWDYKRACWAEEMSPFIEAGVIDAEVAACNEPIWSERGSYEFLVGGHDSVFANANDIPYASKPYISCGTWMTASMENYFQKRDKNCSARFVIAPNGTTLEQFCFRAERIGIDVSRTWVSAFFNKRLSIFTETPIYVFGVYAEEFIEGWSNPDFRLKHVDPENGSFLHLEAAKYAQNAAMSELHIPVPLHQEGAGI